MGIEKATLITAIATLIITGVMASITIYDRWIKPWREGIKKKNSPGFWKKYFKCLWCKKYTEHKKVESQQETIFLYTICTKCSKKLIWSNHDPPKIVEPLKLHRRCVSCQEVSRHELEDVVTKKILVGSKTGDFFYTDWENAPILTTEKLKSLISNSPNNFEVYTTYNMECYARRCLNKKCKELHYWTENHKVIRKRET